MRTNAWGTLSGSVAYLAFTLIFGCHGGILTHARSGSVGRVTDGYLVEGVPLPDRGPGFVRLRPDDATRFGTRGLVTALVRASAIVRQRANGSATLVIGDLSSPYGGQHARHGSHRSGRDADLLFYARSPSSRTAVNREWLAFDANGVAEHQGERFWFDDAHNWQLVRALLLDQSVHIKWIFCSSAIKDRILKHAASHEKNKRLMHRAAWVLQQPSTRNAHDDHFHVRVGCGVEDAASGCEELPPHWPWLSDPARKTDHHALPGLDDEALVRLLLAEQHLNKRRHIGRRGLDAATEPTLVARRERL